MITPIEQRGPFWFKRDDLAFENGPAFASGAKVRQYLSMCREAPPEAPMVVGCSAFSCQQIYVADACRRTGRRGVVFVAERKEPTAATRFCLETPGVSVQFVKPGYLAVVRKRAKDYGKEHKGVRWLPQLATYDAAVQARELPAAPPFKRVVVPLGSGAMLRGIIDGLKGRPVPVLAVAVSDMADRENLRLAAASAGVPLEIERYPGPYERGLYRYYLEGIRLDPWYAAKCVKFMQPGDCLWVIGRRPLQCMQD